jgi:hypothetical protein
MDIAIPTAGDLYNAISRNLDIIRLAAAGRDAEVPALLVFTGAVMDATSTTHTPWGVMRPLTDRERQSAPQSLDGLISGTNEKGQSVTVSYAGDIVLETSLPYRLAVVTDAEMSGDQPRPWPKIGDADQLRERLEGIQLAALMAIEPTPSSFVGLRPAWWWMGDPLSYGRSLGWIDTRASPGLMPHALSDSDCVDLGAWTERIKAHRTANTDIAVRRVISAAHARGEPADRLVDAVIAWENLFGTSEGEPTLRISSAIAWLLGTNFTSRLQLQAEIRSLYAARSRIVHGASPGQANIGELANRALSLAISALMALFRDYPDLLKLGDGAARSLQLIVGGTNLTNGAEAD